jgi:hypothetical protein
MRHPKVQRTEALIGANCPPIRSGARGNSIVFEISSSGYVQRRSVISPAMRPDNDFDILIERNEEPEKTFN